MLESQIIPIDQLPYDDIARMQELMQTHYVNVSADAFHADLQCKDAVIVLRSRGIICGFSTLMLLTRKVCGNKVKVLFSGDTVIEKPYRNSTALPVTWGNLMLTECQTDPTTPLYWLLTSKGYKTYRYLPVFFKDYFPKPSRELTRFEASLLETLTSELFDDRLDRQQWILRSQEHGQKLRPNVAEVTTARLKKEEIAYFVTKNPGHSQGDELVCLARFEPNNLRPFILRKLAAS